MHRMNDVGPPAPTISGEVLDFDPYGAPPPAPEHSLERSGFERHLAASYSPLAQALTPNSGLRTAAGLRRAQNAEITVSQALRDANVSPAQELVTAYMYYISEIERAPPPARPALMAKAEGLARELYRMQINDPQSELAKPLLHFYSRKSDWDAEARIDITGTLEARLPEDKTATVPSHVRKLSHDKPETPAMSGGY